MTAQRPGPSAGQLRALRRLETRLRDAHYRCPHCLDDVAPRVAAPWLVCPLCAGVDRRRIVEIERQPCAGGFRWVARLMEGSIG